MSCFSISSNLFFFKLFFYFTSRCPFFSFLVSKNWTIDTDTKGGNTNALDACGSRPNIGFIYRPNRVYSVDTAKSAQLISARFILGDCVTVTSPYVH